jgi:tRNA 2-thiocytidine biosynthesis protein TtcA
MGRITPSHLMDRSLYPFATLQAAGVADPAGDKAFDDDEACTDPAVVKLAPAFDGRHLTR